MKPTPAHEVANRDLLALIPPRATRVVEAGCSAGALAREYRSANADCDYVGIEIDPGYAELARRHCSRVLSVGLERISDAELDALAPADCWVFGDVLEHLVDPWKLLERIRPRTAAVVACVPNMQHWSVTARLVAGDLFYEEKGGLLDRTHLRWFTQKTLNAMFIGAGYRIISLQGRVFDHPKRAEVLAAVRSFAANIGVDPEAAARDADVMQWLVAASPEPR